MVWKSAAACLGIEVCDDGLSSDAGLVCDAKEDVGAVGAEARATDAVAIDNRDRTRSSGYVEPVDSWTSELQQKKRKESTDKLK